VSAIAGAAGDAFDTIVSDAVCKPSAVGVACTVTTQLPPGAICAGQLPLRLNSLAFVPDKLIVPISNGIEPVFEIVIGCGVDGVLTTLACKFADDGDTEIVGAPVLP
jgi:hypothetical protein